MPQTVTDPRAWRAATIDDVPSWYYPLSDDCLAALRQFLRGWPSATRPITALRLAPKERDYYLREMAPVRDALEHGRGFAIVGTLPLDRLTVPEAQALYWLLGQGLGEPFAQNVQ